MQSVLSYYHTLFFSRIIRIVEIAVDDCNIRLVWKIASSSLQLIEVRRNSVINHETCHLYSSLSMSHISFISSQRLNLQEGLCNSLHWVVFLISWHVELQIIKRYVPSTILFKILIFTSSICLIICNSKLFSSLVIIDHDGRFHIQLIVITRTTTAPAHELVQTNWLSWSKSSAQFKRTSNSSVQLMRTVQTVLMNGTELF